MRTINTNHFFEAEDVMRSYCGGGIVIGTHGPKNLYIPLFLHTILGPDYYLPPVNSAGYSINHFVQASTILRS